MAINNIDDKEYVDLYERKSKNKLIQFFQKQFKYKYVLPILKYSSKDDSFLDIGCARGDFLSFLYEIGYKNLHGLDLDNALPPFLNDNITFYKASVYDPDINLPQFDSVQMASVLHHLPEDKMLDTIYNLKKTVKNGGYLYIYDVNRTSFTGKFFYGYFLRLFPGIYKEVENEKNESILLGQYWKKIVSFLEDDFITISKSDRFFYVSYVGKRL